MDNPNQWWKEDPDLTGMRWEQNLITRDFVNKTDKELRLQGPPNYLKWLANHVSYGYEQQHTSGDGLMCALYALEISLRPLYQLHNKQPPTYERLLSIHQSAEYRLRAARAFCHHYGMPEEFEVSEPVNQYWQQLEDQCLEAFVDQWRGPIEPTKFDFAKYASVHLAPYRHTWETLFNENVLAAEAVSIVLRILRRRDNLRIALGLLVRGRDADELELYHVSIDDGPARRDSLDETHDYHGIAWLINDNVSEDLGEGLSHWSGLAPPFEIQPQVLAHLAEKMAKMQGDSKTTANDAPETDGQGKDTSENAADNTDTSKVPPTTRESTPSNSASDGSSEASKDDSSSNTPNISSDSTPSTTSNATADTSSKTTSDTPNTSLSDNSAKPQPSVLKDMQDFLNRTRYEALKRRNSSSSSSEDENETEGEDNTRPSKLRIPPHFHIVPLTRARRGVVRPSDALRRKHKLLAMDRWLDDSIWRSDIENTNTNTPPEFSGQNQPLTAAQQQLQAAAAHFTGPLSNLTIHNTIRALYPDVCGPAPLGHPDLIGVDMELADLAPQDLELELERIENMRKQPVMNAPPYFEDLPWDDMYDITIEELIMYFPNHVLRWPGLALFLRMSNWDKLFHRVATLINRVRGSQYSNKYFRHAEPLPCMMKVEAAIKELQPEYNLRDHAQWAPLITEEYVWNNLRRRPRRLEGEKLQTVSAKVAASYVLYPEFRDRPFTQRVNQDNLTVPRGKRRSFGNDAHMRDRNDTTDNSPVEGPRQKTPCRLGSSCQKPKCPFSHPDPDDSDDDSMSVDTSEEPTDTDVPQPCRYGAKCQKKETCPYSHPDEDNEKPPKKPCRFGAKCNNKENCPFSHPGEGDDEPPKKPCRFGAKCNQKKTCPFSHPGDGDHKKPQDTKKNICKRNLKCNDASCPLAHQSPAARPGAKIDLSQSCKFAANCGNTKCRRTHPSPASRKEGDGKGKDKKKKGDGNGNSKGGGGNNGGQGNGGNNGNQDGGGNNGGQGNGGNNGNQGNGGNNGDDDDDDEML